MRGLDRSTPTAQHLPLDGGGWEGVSGATVRTEANHPPTLDPSPQGGGSRLVALWSTYSEFCA